MPDFRALVRDQVAPLGLAPGREQKIVDEWSAQLAEIYDGLRAEGRSDEDAWRELQHQLPEWNALADDLLDPEPAPVRIASAAASRVSRRTFTALVRVWRERLTAVCET